MHAACAGQCIHWCTESISASKESVEGQAMKRLQGTISAPKESTQP